VVLQAGAMGLPSIVTDINESNEIILPCENGIIIPSKNILALREAMETIMEHPQLYQHLQQNARPMIQSRYEQKVL
jgi:glycosyltransferase involved in cell wall biosynthesis